MLTRSRVPVIGLASIAALCLATSASGEERPAIATQIAKAYGLDSWDQVEEIRYTFNLDLSALKLKLSRSWVWNPKTNQVTYESKDKTGKPVKVTYSRADVASQSETVKKEIDPAFINDQYWLLFPFHVVWDTGPTIEDAGMQKLPLGKGSARKVVVKYSGDGGYTPGDTWELYVGPDNRVREMLFRHGGTVKPNLVKATWAEHKKAGPLLFSLDHRGTADGKSLRLFFTNVSVKVVGSNSLANAE
jgi:hypothetical protein